jgi:hypothetical protein
MFGWTLIRKDDLKELERSRRVHMRAVECHLWFAGWKDLDIIWEYLLNPHRMIDAARADYAKARGTTKYGEPLEQPRSDEGKE